MELQVFTIRRRIDQRIVSNLAGSISAISAAVAGVIGIHPLAFEGTEGMTTISGDKKSSTVHTYVSSIMSHACISLKNQSVEYPKPLHIASTGMPSLHIAQLS